MTATSILIVRTSALGDVVQAMPVLTALRRHLPESRIGWVVEAAFAPLLRDHPALDETLEVRLRDWRRRPLAARTWRQAREFLGRLDSFAPQIVLDLMGNHKAGLLAAVTLADRRIGLGRTWRREPSSAVWMSESVPAEGVHAVDRMLSVLAGLDLPRETAQFGLDESPRAPLPGELRAGPFAVVLPGAAWANKRYPPAGWGEVARLLAVDPGLPTLVAAGPGEEKLAAGVAVAAAGAAHVLPVLGLAELATLLRRATLVLGGDTGPLHLAHAVGTPVCCVMGPTDPERHGPYGAPQRVVARRLPCSFCHQRLEGVKACLWELSAEEVAARARQILADGPDLPI
jgi:lipopolysaccharide heptosyltransferase I